LGFLSKIINCFTNIFDSKQLKYSPKVYISALRRENGNSRRNEPLATSLPEKRDMRLRNTSSTRIRLLLIKIFWAILMKPKARRKPRDIDKPPDRISQNISITHAQHLTR
jgi:hypothetical protein